MLFSQYSFFLDIKKYTKVINRSTRCEIGRTITTYNALLSDSLWVAKIKKSIVPSLGANLFYFPLDLYFVLLNFVLQSIVL